MDSHFYFITRLPLGNESIVFGQIFDAEFLPDIQVLKSPESKKVVFGNWSARMYVCVCVCVCVTAR